MYKKIFVPVDNSEHSMACIDLAVHLTKQFKVILKPVEQNSDLDYAIFQVDGDPSARFGKISLDPRDPTPGESLLIIHVPFQLAQRFPSLYISYLDKARRKFHHLLSVGAEFGLPTQIG